MKTQCIDMTAKEINSKIIDKAADLIKAGEVVGMPTETVYGLAADALNPKAVSKIFEAKGRPSDNPLIVHIGKREDVEKYAKNILPQTYALMDAFWPGPLTIILHKQPCVPYITTGGLDSVGLRMPNHCIARALINASKTAIAAPSGNISGRPSPTKAKHMMKDMGGKIPMILNGGPCEVGVESTVIDLTVEPAVILRPGDITQAMIEQVIGAVAIAEIEVNKNDAVKSPGMKYKHYSPNAEIILVNGKDESVNEWIDKYIKKEERQSNKVGILTFEENTGLFECDNVIIIGHKYNYREIEKNLFNALIQMEEWGVNIIVAPYIQEEDQGVAIMNRLLRAANFNVIDV